MLICLRGGHVIDPATKRDAVGDVYFENGRIVEKPDGREPDETHDVSGHIVMAGAIDIHSHIAGGNVNTARLLLPEKHRAIRARLGDMPLSTAKWSTYETGRLYAQMGFTTVVEPAVAPHHALQAHLELADMPLHRQRRAHRRSATTISCSNSCATARASMRSTTMSHARWTPRAPSASNASIPAASKASRKICASSGSTTWCRSTASVRGGSSSRCRRRR